MNRVPEIERHVHALALAYLCITDTPSGVREYWKEREACSGIVAHLEGCPPESRICRQSDRDWLVSLFRQMIGEDAL